MFKLAKANLREIVSVIVLLALVFGGLLLLQRVDVSQNAALSALVSLFVSILGGVLKFAVALGLAWVGLAVTLPEANLFVLHSSFDRWWGSLEDEQRGRYSLIGAAVLVIAASLCIAS